MINSLVCFGVQAAVVTMTRMQSTFDNTGIAAIGLWVAIIVAYYTGTRLGQLLILEPNLASPVWPPTGIAIATTLRWGYRVGPAIFIGALISSKLDGSEALPLLLSGLNNTLEPIA